jgi:DNA-directed RNA polymerase subunit RPC12/RpoP
MKWWKKIKSLLLNRNQAIRYVCLSCKTEEDIPQDVVEYFDIMDLGDQRVPPRFKCEKCGREMWPLNSVHSSKKR